MVEHICSVVYGKYIDVYRRKEFGIFEIYAASYIQGDTKGATILACIARGRFPPIVLSVPPPLRCATLFIVCSSQLFHLVRAIVSTKFSTTDFVVFLE